MNSSNQPYISQTVNDDEKRFVCKSLFQYNVNQTASLLQKPGIDIELLLKSPKNEVIGGVFCETFLYCLYINELWIEEKYRGLGYGKMLVTEAERVAKENGCTLAHTATFSFQSPEFYRKLGYKEFGVINDYPEGIVEYFLKKKL